MILKISCPKWKKNKQSKLEERIEFLKSKQNVEFILLKNQFKDTFDSLRPINLIKDTFNEVVHSPEIKNDLLKYSIGSLGGYVSKKMVFGNSNNIFKKISGAFLQFAIANLITNKIKQKN
jgi:hypothetical protein